MSQGTDLRADVDGVMRNSQRGHTISYNDIYKQLGNEPEIAT
jgi:hypothetical protein